MEQEIKKGDRVLIKRTYHGSNVIWVSQMNKYVGTEQTIDDVRATFVRLVDNIWSFPKESLELITEDKPKFKKGDIIKVVRRGSSETCRWIQPMDKHLNKKLTVTGTTMRGNLEVNETGLVFAPQSCELVEKEDTAVIEPIDSTEYIRLKKKWEGSPITRDQLNNWVEKERCKNLIGVKGYNTDHRVWHRQTGGRFASDSTIKTVKVVEGKIAGLLFNNWWINLEGLQKLDAKPKEPTIETKYLALIGTVIPSKALANWLSAPGNYSAPSTDYKWGRFSGEVMTANKILDVTIKNGKPAGRLSKYADMYINLEGLNIYLTRYLAIERYMQGIDPHEAPKPEVKAITKSIKTIDSSKLKVAELPIRRKRK